MGEFVAQLILDSAASLAQGLDNAQNDGMALLAPSPKPMLKQNYETEQDMCYHGQDLFNVVESHVSCGCKGYGDQQKRSQFVGTCVLCFVGIHVVCIDCVDSLKQMCNRWHICQGGLKTCTLLQQHVANYTRQYPRQLELSIRSKTHHP